MLLLAACTGSDDAPPTPTSTPTVTSTATVTGTPIPSADSLDFANPEVVGPLVNHFGGGEVQPERVEYHDYTADGSDEAVVVVESGGTQGDLGAAVLQGDGTVLAYIDAGGKIETRLTEAGGGVIASIEGIWQPADPECCPSQLRERTYAWDGTTFALSTDQVIANDRKDEGY